jgi:hypothetical protein
MTGTFKTQIKGVIRFSYLSESGFSVSKQGTDYVREMLFNPARLDRRFTLFETLTLPSLLSQDDPEFQLALLVSDELPTAARDRLADLIDPLPGAQIVSLPQIGHYQAIKTAFAALPDEPGATHTATLRLDDDDAMHRSVVARLKLLADHNLAIRDPELPFVIGFNRGYYLDMNSPDLSVTDMFEKTPLGVGLTLVAPLDAPMNIYRRNHRALGEFFDCYTEVAQPMFIRTVHRDNDSQAVATGRTGRRLGRNKARILAEDFGVFLNGLTPDRAQ